jgi:hypothetical protein
MPTATRPAGTRSCYWSLLDPSRRRRSTIAGHGLRQRKPVSLGIRALCQPNPLAGSLDRGRVNRTSSGLDGRASSIEVVGLKAKAGRHRLAPATPVQRYDSSCTAGKLGPIRCLERQRQPDRVPVERDGSVHVGDHEHEVRLSDFHERDRTRV